MLEELNVKTCVCVLGTTLAWKAERACSLTRLTWRMSCGENILTISMFCAQRQPPFRKYTTTGRNDVCSLSPRNYQQERPFSRDENVACVTQRDTHAPSSVRRQVASTVAQTFSCLWVFSRNTTYWEKTSFSGGNGPNKEQVLVQTASNLH